MDFRQITQPNSGRPAAVNSMPDVPGHKEEKGSGKKAKGGNWMQMVSGVMLVSIALLVAAVALILARSGGSNESKYINTKKYQAVFLNNGQVYFGNITGLNSEYVHMSNIYYLTQSSDSSGNANGNYTLVKLGCQQIHDPLDEMVINRAQVTFWENLQDNGKVVSSINEFKKQNPNGPDCSKVSNQTQASSSTTQGSATNTNGSNSTNNSSSH